MARKLEELQGELNTLTKEADKIIERKKGLEEEAARMIQARKPAGLPVVGNRSDSDEQKCLRMFGAKSVKELITVNTGLPKYRHVPQHLKDIVTDLKGQVDCARIISQLFHGDPWDRVVGKDVIVSSVKNILQSSYGKEFGIRLKAFDTNVPTAGGNWVPTLMAQTYIEEYNLAYAVEDKFTNITMPSNPYLHPLQTSQSKARIIAENTTQTQGTFTTGQLEFHADKLGEYYVFSTEITEDTAPDMIALGRSELVDSQRRAVESAIINGDGSAPHIDSDIAAGPADLAEKIWNGLRVYALDNSANGGTTDFGGAAPTEPLLRAMRANMKKFGVNSADLMFITGPAVYQHLMNLPNVSTVDKFGPQATVLRGALAAYQGVPIITSEFMREDLSATGVFDGLVSDFGGLLLVNMRRFWTATRQGIQMRIAQSLPGDDQLLMASYQRRDFKGVPQSATETSVNYGINILVG